MFNTQRGSYTLLGKDILEGEVSDKSAKNIIRLKTNSVDTKEYLLETFARNKGWVKLAKEIFGMHCLYPKCCNTFMKNNGQRYIEVHHIVPLHEGGEDGIWNLSVVCAHHHKMAHFANTDTKNKIKELLIIETKARI